jgi:hypothetical protein
MNSLLPVLALLALSAGPQPAADLSKIDRTIRKEPIYHSKTATFCLVVFGSQAKNRVWLARDGDFLYVDLNGNGDLTEEGKHLRLVSHPLGFKAVLTPVMSAGDGAPRNTRLKVKFCGDEVEMYALNERVQYVASDAGGLFHFAAAPALAPIVHFGGPLTLSPHAKYTLRRNREGVKFSVKVGTRGLGPGSFAACYENEVDAKLPRGLVPVLDIAFPPRVAGAPRIKTSLRLSDRC